MSDERPLQDRSASGRERQTASIAIGCLVLAALLSLAVGPVSLSDPALREVVLTLRLTRTAMAGIAGACLAVAGVLMQGVFRNPLADPGVIGAQSGAILGGQLAFLAIAIGGERLPAWAAPELALPLGCVLGAFAALMALLALARRQHGSLLVLLSGFLIGTVCMGLSGLISSIAVHDSDLAHGLVSFNLGGVDGKGWHHFALAAPLGLGAIAGARMLGRQLDVLLAGEEEAAAMGLRLDELRRWAIIWCALLTAAATVAAGAVAFVGLLVPHVLRARIGASHRPLIPLAAIAGAASVIAADVLARMLPTISPPPVSVITGIIGAPLFFWLLARSSRLEA